MKLIIAGDYCPQARVQQLIDKDKGEIVFQDILGIIKNADYSIANLECAVVNGKDANPIVKFGPCLSTNTKGIELLKRIGFSCVTLANNHFRDFGNKGIENALRDLNNNGIDYLGAGRDLNEATAVMYKTIKGIRMGVINICEHEFSLATEQNAGTAPLDSIENYRQIKEARAQADKVIIIVHGGSEGYQLPSPRMKKTYQWFIDIGADVVINHHQHCYSGYEIYKGKPIFYGLGNFCFDEDGARNSLWNHGYLLCLDIEESIKFEIIPYEQCNEKPIIRLYNRDELLTFNHSLERLNSIIENYDLLKKEFEHFLLKKKGYLGVISPYLNEHVRAIASRHWIPYLIPRKKLLNILNFIECESHRDILIGVIKNKLFYD